VRAIAIVNGTARRLSDRLRGKLARALPGGVVFTHSLEEARGAIRAEVARGVDLIVFGGGDGTFVMGLALIGEACRGAGRPEPAIGVLRLGSANAIADAAGASADPATDLARLARGDGAWRPMRMLHVLGFRAPFVGLGADAQVLEDREAIARVVDRVPGARRLVGDAARSALSIALQTVARLAAPPHLHAVISNAGAPAIELGRGGAAGRSLAAGEVLWSGRCTLVAGSTTPYFGFGARPFPFAGARGDRFHLRCGEAGWLDLLRGAPAAFRGGHPSAQIHDFLCDRVQIHLDDEIAIEAGGELLGRRRSLEIELGAPVTVARLA
jgi:diacylglycerol kinase family enzyme